MLADPAVDIATFPEQRIPIMRQALAAGKHILAQKRWRWIWIRRTPSGRPAQCGRLAMKNDAKAIYAK
jgi:hypothetical protein